MPRYGFHFLKITGSSFIIIITNNDSGSYEKFSKKGNLVEKGSYHRDKKEGHWILIERPFYRSEGSFHRDNKLGIWKKFKGKLLKSKQKYYLGRLDGVSYEYFSNGNTKGNVS